MASNEFIPEDSINYELDYFTDQVSQKILSKNDWTKIDHKLLPSLVTRLAQQKKPIDNEIQRSQKKISSTDA